MLSDIEQLSQGYLIDPLDFVSERFIFRIERYTDYENTGDVNVKYLETIGELHDLNRQYSCETDCFIIDNIFEFCEKLKLNNEYTLYEDEQISIIVIRETKY